MVYCARNMSCSGRNERLCSQCGSALLATPTGKVDATLCRSVRLKQDVVQATVAVHPRRVHLDKAELSAALHVRRHADIHSCSVVVS